MWQRTSKESSGVMVSGGLLTSALMSPQEMFAKAANPHRVFAGSVQQIYEFHEACWHTGTPPTQAGLYSCRRHPLPCPTGSNRYCY